MKKWGIICLIMAAWAVCHGAAETAGSENNSWMVLQQRFEAPVDRFEPTGRRGKAPAVAGDTANAARTGGLSRKPENSEISDPWQALRSVFLPFSRQEEDMARHQAVHARTFQDRFAARLKPYQSIIAAASRQFDIPQALLKALIMAESGGNPEARAGITSAKGLMQTIDSTFNMARTGLAKKGIAILNDPFDPEASIMAGAWYMDRMYQQALSDGKMALTDRDDIDSWRYPLEYYYAGPGNGIKAANKVQVYSNGETRIIDKRAYSGKIQSWAQILAAS